MRMGSEYAKSGGSNELNAGSGRWSRPIGSATAEIPVANAWIG